MQSECGGPASRMSSNFPTISVLMAVYNPPRYYLDEAIGSVLSQSFADYEFIIVNDGSNEATHRQLQCWADRDPRVRLHRLASNVGLTRALNAGLGLARGAYIARQDADDVSGAKRLAALLTFLEHHPEFDAVGSNAVLINARGDQSGTMEIDPTLRGLFRRNLLVHGSMMFRRRVFDEVGGYDERMRLSQDYELYLRMIRLHGMRLGVLPEAHYFLRQHPASLSSRRIFRQLYYSVMAKSLADAHGNMLWRGLKFSKDLVVDFFVTHRLFLGPVVRSAFRGRKSTKRSHSSEMKSGFKSVSACRLCGNNNLIEVVDLGQQYLTGVFPRSAETPHLTKGPLQVVKCHGDGDGGGVCGLVQLRHTYDAGEMYGDNYGYRSGLNGSMVAHLHSKIHAVIARVDLSPGDLVIDIGSNDGTSLAAYPGHLTRVGVDPVGMKFKEYYPPGVMLIPALFSADLVTGKFPGQKAKVITSFSMMYDLEDPQGFVREIASLLDPECGIWVFEQSYLPLMLEKMAFDTICHEHIEYYGLKQIEWLLERANMKILDVEFNDVNGGSFSVTAAHRSACYRESTGSINEALRREDAQGLGKLDTYAAFSTSIDGACDELKHFLSKAKAEGRRVCGIGASTKGNVLLQHCGLTADDIEVIGEINPDKFGAVTPGTWIPIEDEASVLASKPDYLLVLPWHFRDNFLNNPAYKGYQLVFPLPALEVVRA
jgi:NDP-4-keto-2,6-dideoxyhexose 3-C-methyltransferase